MKNVKIDFFKSAIVILFCVFLYFYINNSEVGRFQMTDNYLIDTKTGEVYQRTLYDKFDRISPPIKDKN